MRGGDRGQQTCGEVTEDRQQQKQQKKSAGRRKTDRGQQKKSNVRRGDRRQRADVSPHGGCPTRHSSIHPTDQQTDGLKMDTDRANAWVGVCACVFGGWGGGGGGEPNPPASGDALVLDSLLADVHRHTCFRSLFSFISHFLHLLHHLRLSRPELVAQPQHRRGRAGVQGQREGTPPQPFAGLQADPVARTSTLASTLHARMRSLDLLTLTERVLSCVWLRVCVRACTCVRVCVCVRACVSRPCFCFALLLT